MASIDSILNVVVSATTATLNEAGFGTILILGPTARSGTDLVRYYTTTTGVAADYATTTPEYRLAQRVFAQSPRPQRVAIGKRANVPTHALTFTPTLANSTRYAFELEGTTVEYTSDASATLAEITAGLLAAMSAITGVTATATATTLLVESNTAGSVLQANVITRSVLAMEDTTTDAGVATDLDAILLEQPDWYGVLTPFSSQEELMAIAEWVEANKRLFFYDVVDTAVFTTAYNSASPDDDIGGALLSRSYERSYGFPVRDTTDWAAAGFLGYLLATTPGSISLHLKSAVGVPALSLTSTEETNIRARNLNPYVPISGKSVLLDGKAAVGEYADVIRDSDWLVARIKERVFGAMAGADKVPYTNAGVGIITSALSGMAQEGEQAGVLAAGWRVTAPKVEDVSAADKAARKLPNVTLVGTYAGAIHYVDPITITLTP